MGFFVCGMMVSALLNLEMYNSPELPRIDRYTCKFENPVLEEQYMGEQWSRVKKALNFAFGLMSLVMLVDFYEASILFRCSKHSLFQTINKLI